MKWFRRGINIQRDSSFEQLKSGSWYSGRNGERDSERDTLEKFSDRFSAKRIWSQSLAGIFFSLLAATLVVLSVVAYRYVPTPSLEIQEDELGYHAWSVEVDFGQKVDIPDQRPAYYREQTVTATPRLDKVAQKQDTIAKATKPILTAKLGMAISGPINSLVPVLEVPRDLVAPFASEPMPQISHGHLGEFNYVEDSASLGLSSYVHKKIELPAQETSGLQPEMDFDVIARIKALGQGLAICGDELSSDAEVRLKFSIKNGEVVPASWNQIDLSDTDAQECMSEILEQNSVKAQEGDEWHLTLSLTRL